MPNSNTDPMEEEVAIKPPSSTPLLLKLKIRLLLSLASIAIRVTIRHNGTINRRLFKYLDLKASPSSTPIKGVKTHDVTVDPSRNLWFRLFTPTVGDNLPVIIHFHGGGYVYFGPDSKISDDWCRRIARQVQAVVVSVNYRLAPEHRYPAQEEDGIDALKFLDDKINGKHLPESADLFRCFLAGDSAGGNLAHHVARRASEFEFENLKVIGLVALQPFFGGEEREEAEKRCEKWSIDGLSIKTTDFYWKSFMPLLPGGMECDRDHEAVNVSGPKAVDISKLDFPATLVVVGGSDILQDWQRKYYRWLKSSGKEAHLVEYPNMFHGFYAFPQLPECSNLIKEMTDFVNKQISHHLKLKA